MTKQNCVYSYILTPTNTDPCIYTDMWNIFNFSEWNSLAFLLLGIQKTPFFSSFSFLLSKFPFSCFYHRILSCYPHCLLSFSPHQYYIFPTQQLFNRQHALVFCAAGGGNGIEEIHPVNFQYTKPENKTLDSKYKAKV